MCRGRRFARAGPGGAGRASGQMLALDPPLGASIRADATIGGVFATADSGPLRHRYGAPRDLRARRHRRAQRRDDRPGRRQGDQERRRLRPRQAVHGLVRHARADPVGVRPVASARRRITASALGSTGDPETLSVAASGARGRATRARCARCRLARRSRRSACPRRRRRGRSPGRSRRRDDAQQRSRAGRSRRGRPSAVGTPARRTALAQPRDGEARCAAARARRRDRRGRRERRHAGRASGARHELHRDRSRLGRPPARGSPADRR